MNWILPAIISFFSAILGALGMGGGSILLIYLTAYADMEQLTSQGINLIFFIPVAIVALIIHARKKLVVWKATLAFVLIGLAGVFAGYKTAEALGSSWLSKLFGGFLLIIGVREWILSCKKN